MARDEPHLRVQLADDRGLPVRAPGLAGWLRRVAPARARGTVSIALVSDARIRALNKKYRRKDYATDVLSFPAFARMKTARASARQARTQNPGTQNPRTRNPRTKNREPGTRNREPVLGDIVIARGVARRQAREARHSEATELKVLALHGLLHLLGYDHECDNGRMRRVEERLRRKGGLTAGLIERTGHPHPRRAPGTRHRAPRRP